MEAIVLAGGCGTRLHPLTQTRPKPILPIAGVPILHRIVGYLEANGFDKIIITLNHLHEQIESSFENRPDYSAEIIFSEETTSLGTAGSVKNAAKHIEDTFLVIQGDTITNINLGRVMAFHLKHDAPATIVLKDHPNAFVLGAADIDSQMNITRFIEKPASKDVQGGLVNTGIYLLEPNVLDHIPEDMFFDFAKDLFPAMLQRGLGLKGLPMDGFGLMGEVLFRN
ncbi:MAG: nucleotidyltransferase family protein, partial [Thaumarchaeota archaeon]|nr:nucleotidyltransferase family protein [Nitrososphaerota archaeon]